MCGVYKGCMKVYHFNNMPRVNSKQLSPKQKMDLLNLLWIIVVSLKNKEEVKNFFKDLLSETESIMLARRILIAKKLLEEKSYDEIINELKVGNSTVASVHRWLISGFGGYQKALKRFKTAEKRKII